MLLKRVAGFACMVALGLLSTSAWAGGWVFQHAIERMQHALVVDAAEKTPLYLCRVPHGKAMYPGITGSAEQPCRFLKAGRVIHKQRYQVYMTTPKERPGQWRPAAFGGVPPHAWAVGWGLKEQMYYVCRVTYKKQLYFGVVRAVRHGYCDTFDQRDTRDFHHYEVLTLKHDRFAHIWF